MYIAEMYTHIWEESWQFWSILSNEYLSPIFWKSEKKHRGYRAKHWHGSIGKMQESRKKNAQVVKPHEPTALSACPVPLQVKWTGPATVNSTFTPSNVFDIWIVLMYSHLKHRNTNFCFTRSTLGQLKCKIYFPVRSKNSLDTAMGYDARWGVTVGGTSVRIYIFIS